VDARRQRHDGAVSSIKNKAIVPIALLYVLIHSATFVSIKVGLEYCPPMTLLSLRFMLAGAVTGLLARAAGVTWPVTRQAWARLFLLGIVNTALPASFNFFAMHHVSVGVAAIIVSTNPLVLALVAPRILGERLTMSRLLGILLGFSGVVFVMAVRVGAGRADTPGGVFLLFCGMSSMVAGTVLFKRFPPREHLLVVNTVQLVVAGLALVPLFMATEKPSAIALNLPLLGAIAYMVLGMSVGATLLWFWLLSRGEASAVSAFYFLSPIFGIALGAVFFHEHFGWREGLGLIVICTGIIMIRRTG
jgi:drug/metabolite transporter (DMT)-like permease